MAELRKVAHIMRWFVPEKWGGTESVVFNVSHELIRQGVESPIFCTDMFSTPGVQMFGTVPVKRFRYVFPWFGFLWWRIVLAASQGSARISKIPCWWSRIMKCSSPRAWRDWRRMKGFVPLFQRALSRPLRPVVVAKMLEIYSRILHD